MSFDPAFYVKRRPSAVEQLAGTMFDEPQEAVVEVPDIRTPVVSAPGSASSRRASATLDNGARRASWRAVILALASVSAPISRESLCARVGMKESSACARLDELRPLWVEAVPLACVSSSGLRVDGYRLTEAGRARVQQAMREVRP